MELNIATIAQRGCSKGGVRKGGEQSLKKKGDKGKGIQGHSSWKLIVGLKSERY